MRQILLAIGVVAIALVLLGIRVILKRNGRFSSQHISQNTLMRKRGIHCVNSQDREARTENKRKINVKNI